MYKNFHKTASKLFIVVIFSFILGILINRSALSKSSLSQFYNPGFFNSYLYNYYPCYDWYSDRYSSFTYKQICSPYIQSFKYLQPDLFLSSPTYSPYYYSNYQYLVPKFEYLQPDFLLNFPIYSPYYYSTNYQYLIPKYGHLCYWTPYFPTLATTSYTIPIWEQFGGQLLDILGNRGGQLYNVNAPSLPLLENPYKNFSNLYKGQIHCHSYNSPDVCQEDYLSPSGVEEAYKGKGYHFICLTDHNQSTPDPGVDGILHILSGEDGYADAHHIEVLGINKEKVQWYHDNYDDTRDEDQDGLDDLPSEPSTNIQPRINYATLIQGAVAVLGHPQSSSEGYSLGELLTNYNYTGIEIYNGGWDTAVGDKPGASCPSDCWWDRVLSDREHMRKSHSQYQKVWGFASDDCHNVHNKNFNRGWIVVNSEQKDLDLGDPGTKTEDILRNIKSGNFYSVVRSPNQDNVVSDGTRGIGIEMKIYLIGNLLCVTTDPNTKIVFRGESGEVLDESEYYDTISYYEVTGKEYYIRVEAEPKQGEEFLKAYSQPLYAQQNYPNPKVRFHEHETKEFTEEGTYYIKYKLSIDNWFEYHSQLFVSDSKFGSCGSNKNASRTSVEIFEYREPDWLCEECRANCDLNPATPEINCSICEGLCNPYTRSLKQYCDIHSNTDLSDLYFTLPKNEIFSGQIVVRLYDRLCEKYYTSAPVSVYP